MGTNGSDASDNSLKNFTKMNNTEGHGNPESIYWRVDWIICESIIAILTVISIYIFINTLRYTLKKKNSPGRDIGSKQSKQLHVMCTIASGFAMLRVMSDHAVAFYGQHSDQACSVTITISTVLIGLSLLSVYIFLWMRQSIFYANPVLAKVLNKAITALSWSTLVAMLISGVCLTVLYCLPEVTGWVYKVTEKGCSELSSIETDDVVPTITLVTTIYFQFTLLVLFLYPLLSRKTQRYRSAGKKNNPSNGDNSYSQHPSSVSNNTDDNLTDGDITASHSAPNSATPRTKIEKSARIQSDRKREREIESDNESGVDVQGPSDKSSESISSGGGNNENQTEWKGYITTHRESGVQLHDPSEITEPRETKQKRRSIFANTKLFKSRSLFYRRHQSRLGEVPTAKRSRAKTVATVSLKLERDGTKKTRKTSKESNNSEWKKKLRRRKRTQQGRRMMLYLRKVFYLMIICVLTDVTATVLQDRIELPELIYLTVFDLSLMVNIICIILSFRDWNVILFPMCAKAPRKDSFSESIKGSIKMGRNDVTRKKDPIRRAAASVESGSEMASPSAIQHHRQRLTEGMGSFSSTNPNTSASESLETNGKRNGHIPGLVQKQET